MGFLTFLAGKSKKATAKIKDKKDNVDVKEKKQKTKRVLKTENAEAVENYMACLNRHGSVDEMLKLFTSENAKIKFDDSPSMTALGLVTEIRNCYLGFGDLKFNYESIKEVKPGQVLVEDLVVTGTHTQDFQFANFPVIPRTNKHVLLDPERLWFTMKDGKIYKQEITALGNLTGPPGMYLLVGGRLEPPAQD
ncbi:expressed unknown protein [Seminavis robusta]|uniref:SnoaL-like domain-containing protein n=1 Tax=Seminavis robusta TaxID=568900 RepID=A0A9N8DLD3_9STRA|nr:expressed unknown protein [Seminavis robusta]|eukprot:Sro148_g068280.1 n/a (193) ;mRNA; f:95490-96136